MFGDFLFRNHQSPFNKYSKDFKTSLSLNIYRRTYKLNYSSINPRQLKCVAFLSFHLCIQPQICDADGQCVVVVLFFHTPKYQLLIEENALHGQCVCFCVCVCVNERQGWCFPCVLLFALPTNTLPYFFIFHWNS